MCRSVASLVGAVLVGSAWAVGPAVRCVDEGTSSVTVAVGWDDVPNTDLYMVNVYSRSGAAAELRPALVMTTPNNSAVLEDALPNTTYYIAVQAHPLSAPAIVRNWGPVGPVQTCTSKSVAPGAAHSLTRVGELGSTRVHFQWSPPQSTPNTISSSDGIVRWRKATNNNIEWKSMPTPAAAAASTAAATTTNTTKAVVIDQLDPDSSYMVSVDHEGTGDWSDPVRFATGPSLSAAIVATEVYRVSEGTHAIDLLENHNSGDLVGEAAFLTDSGNFVLPWEQLANDPCVAAINSSTSCKVGGKDSCMSCLSTTWAKANLTNPFKQQCSDPAEPWPFDNNVAEAFCGIGFSFFDWTATPVTKYCIRRTTTSVGSSGASGVGGGGEGVADAAVVEETRSSVAAAPRLPAADGFAEYMSCNAPEAAVVNNNPDDPICICACFADRMIGEQTLNEVTPRCGQVNASSFVYPQCNCSKDSVLMPPDSPSLTTMGALQVQCPYFYYVIPEASYPLKTACGLWYSHPRAGSCNHPSPATPRKLGEGCSWERLPVGVVVYGDALLAAGWDRSSSFDDKTGHRKDTTNQTQANAKAIARAFVAMQKPLFSERCCGC